MPDELPPALASLDRIALQQADDLPFLRHAAEQLLAGGYPSRALPHVAAVLAAAPGDAEALRLLAQVTAQLGAASPASPAAPDPAAAPVDPGTGATPGAGARAEAPSDVDWSVFERQLVDVPADLASPGALDDLDVERPVVTLADVAGLDAVKERLHVSFLTPLRNPELRRAYGSRLRGGLLLWGPPGCGKTYIARALAGELGARFLSVGLADVLDMWVGSSERNLRDVFATARRTAPCVLFLDELDALGQRRSQLRSSPALRGVVNSLLEETDGVSRRDDGVFLLGATNAPWDLDPALKRPGRFDRTVLVVPPDAPARARILAAAMSDRPQERLDPTPVVRATEGWSAADVTAVADDAARRALTRAARSGRVEPLTQDDLVAAVRAGHDSTRGWFETARAVAEYANRAGEYDELLPYLKRRR